MSDAISGVGTQFRRWEAIAYVKVAEVVSISGPSMTRETIDVTSLDSVGGYKEFKSSFRDGGTVNLTMNFTRANYDLFKADFEASDPVAYEIVFPDAQTTTFEFTGLVTELPVEIPTGDKISMTVGIKVSGQVVVNSGSGS